MNSSVPITATGIIPVNQQDVGGIPPIALVIPDFEGQAVLRIFGNSTKSEIGCYSAVITNGATFSHPNAVGSALGIFTFVALAASFATAVYGNHIPTMRTHYAHSLSIFVVFAVLHHIFFTGALSMNWPSVLTAWWSNFAWSAGMIYSESMQNSINQLIGSNRGNTSIVGAAGTGSAANNVGGGYQLSQIYKRASLDLMSRYIEKPDLDHEAVLKRRLETSLAKRSLKNATEGFSWYGYPVKPGLPIPGNFSGFAGTLSKEEIPASNAFMTGFLWLLILITLLAASTAAFKLIIEGLSKKKLIRTDRLVHFRAHWLAYTAQAALRAVFIGFFMMMFLTMFEFTYKGPAGVTAIAALVFLILFLGMFGIAGYALFQRLRLGHYESVPDRMHLMKTKGIGPLPFFRLERESIGSEKSEKKKSVGSLPWWSIHYIEDDPQSLQVHQDEDYTIKFGWLAARFRRTRWWFFSLWLVYEFLRACFYGGAAGHPMTQVFGLLIVEFFALVVIVTLKPFEGARLNALMVYLLGFSKVATVALSAAFNARFNLARITTTVIGVVIIVIQGILTIVLLIAIVIGAVSSYMSLTRNHEGFKPKSWMPLRQRYFAHIENAATDVRTPPPPPPEEPKGPYFNVTSVRRVNKIEDEEDDFIGSQTSVARPVTTPNTARGSRANSLRSPLDSSSANVPFGARIHRASWSTRDFNEYNSQNNRDSRIESNRSSRVWSSPGSPAPRLNNGSLNDLTEAGQRRARTPSKIEGGLDVMKTRNGKEREEPLAERVSEERKEST